MSDEEMVVKIGKAISHPTRLLMIRDLRRDAEFSPTDFNERHAGEKVGDGAYHLKVLRDIGLATVVRTQTRRRGKERVHALKSGALTSMTLAILDVLEAGTNSG